MDRIARHLPGSLGRLILELASGEGQRARSGRGAVLAFAIRILSAGIAFVSQVLLARWMGSFEFGVFTYAWVWVAILGTLCTLGFSTSVVRFLPQYREAGDLAHLRGFLRFGRALALASGIACMAIGGALLLAADGALDRPYLVPLGLSLIGLPAFALTDFQDGVGRAQGWLGLALLPPYVLRPVLLIVFIAASIGLGHGRDAVTAAAAAVAATWIAAALQFVLQRRRMARQLAPGPCRRQPKAWFAVSLPLLLLDGFTLLMLNLDVLLLNLFVTPDRIGIYFAAARTISLVSFVHFAVTAVAMPQFARLHAAGDGPGIFAHLKATQRWCLAPAAAGAVLLLLLGKPLLALFGAEFTAAYPVMVILAAGLLIRALGGPAQSLLVVAGHQQAAALILLAAVLLNAGLCLALIPRFGLAGAAAATAAAFAFESLATLAVAYRHCGSSLPAAGESHGAPAG